MPTTSTPTLAAAAAIPLRTAADGAPDDTYVLAVDLGTGGPKVAVVSATGRIAAHAFEKVGVVLTPDGGAEQTPQDWWNAIVASARRAVAESGVSPERIVGVGCTAQWSGTVPIGGDAQAIGPSIIWLDSR
jgi:xylulokinase